jgi:hypothetical protein
MKALKPLATRPLPPPPKPAAKSMSAADALRAAMEAERNPPRAAAPAAAPEPAPAPKKPKKPAAPPPALDADAAAGPLGAFQRLVPSAVLGPSIPVTRHEVFKALWRAHRARAQSDADLPLLATAVALLDAIDRTAIVAVRAEIGDESWAVWLDETGRLLGAAQPADVYLAGL